MENKYDDDDESGSQRSVVSQWWVSYLLGEIRDGSVWTS